ncbi:MAG: hypothetical protein IJJ69_02820, partial [Oscillospiraceae bacterium]|nr:hypothetical protein [Oscillospiraceae bacterium]
MIKKKNNLIISCCLLLLLSGCANDKNITASEEEISAELTESETDTLPETETETEFIWTEPPTEP